MFDDCGEGLVVLVEAEDLGKSGEDDLEDLDVSEEGGLDWGVGFCEEEDGDKTLEGMRSFSSLAMSGNFSSSFFTRSSQVGQLSFAGVGETALE